MRLWIAASILALCAAAALAGPAATRPHRVRVVLAGDSTVTDATGWGKGFADCLTSDVEVINLSRGGRSSGSFVKEGLWRKALDLKPDYVLVQFGHNDSPGHGADRETDPQTTYKANMTRYVDDAGAAGIRVVLVTSLSRRQWGKDGKIHSTLQPYVDVVKSIAADRHVPLIDLHARSIELYERLGKDAVLDLSPTKPAKGDDAASVNQGYDGTHLNAKGGRVVGRLVGDEFAKAVPAMAASVKPAVRGKD